jgi:broad specificity phosphatase PhoE
MGWPRNLILVRHAESEGNVLTVNQRAMFEHSTYLYSLTEKGRKQAEFTGMYLKEKFPDGFDVKYISYYTRSRETMDIMYPNSKLYEDPRLAEAQRGIYHSMTSDQIREKFPEEIARKEREGLYHYRPWGGENWPDVELRIHSFMGTLSRDCEGQDVVIVVHGHWLLLFQRLIHHFSIDEAIRKYKAGVFSNASVTHYIRAADRERMLKVSENVIPWEGKI